MSKKNAILTLKLIFLLILLIFSFLNLKTTLDETITETNTLTFIKDPPVQDYIFKKFAYISGEISKPGVYELRNDNTTLLELINLAGGLTKEADQDYINKTLNLSSIVKDSDHIFIPNKQVSSNATSQTNTGDKININNATSEELDTLPGIGPSTAKKIIQSRPFSNIEDIKNVSGIGDSKYNQIKDLITVEQ